MESAAFLQPQGARLTDHLKNDMFLFFKHCLYFSDLQTSSSFIRAAPTAVLKDKTHLVMYFMGSFWGLLDWEVFEFANMKY